MPNWTTQPPKDSGPHAFRIVRTPADKPITAIATATEIIGCPTHYAANRTIPCEGPDSCPWCADGYSWRWHGYLAAILTATLEHVLFEMTAQAADTFDNYAMLHGNLRGCHFTAHRPSKRHNGRVVIACKPTDEQRTRLPQPPDVKRILCHVWNVKHDQAVHNHHIRRCAETIGAKDDGNDGRYRP